MKPDEVASRNSINNFKNLSVKDQTIRAIIFDEEKHSNNSNKKTSGPTERILVQKHNFYMIRLFVGGIFEDIGIV